MLLLMNYKERKTMDFETLKKANELNEKIVKNSKILEKIDFLSDKDGKRKEYCQTNRSPYNNLVVTDYNNGVIEIPKTLVPVIMHFLYEHYNGICEDLKSEFEKL